MVGLGVALYFAWQSLIPKAAEAVAHRIPREAEKSLGTIALQSLDRWLLKTSRLDAGELAAARKVFDSLAARAALSDAVELQFRDTAPNALALPGGTIVVTDGLVKLFRADERLLAAVIAHELGHVHHRHSLRHLLEGSASALIVGALVGDVSGVSTLTVNAPILLSTLHYTRESEREADQYAFDLLRRDGRSPKDFADAMRRFEAMELCMAMRAKARDEALKQAGSNVDHREEPAAKERIADSCTDNPDKALEGRDSELADLRRQDRETGYMHTHPVTRERIAAAEAAAGK
jgi:Zn-dependent protease with chaperone function